MDERAIAEHASDDLSDEAFNERESIKYEMEEERDLALEHIRKMRQAARKLNVSSRAIMELNDMSSRLSGYGLWLLDFGRDESRPVKPVLPKEYSAQEIEESAIELAFQIEDWAERGENLEERLKDYIPGAWVSFDSAGNVVDGVLHIDYSPWRITPQGVTGCIPYKHLTSRISGVSFRRETSVKILEMLDRLYKDGRIKGKSLYDEEDVEEE